MDCARIRLTNDIDTLKGSYYANPIVDVPNVSPAMKEQHREYYRDNICEIESA